MANRKNELKVARAGYTVCRFHTGRGPDKKKAENKQLTGAFGFRLVLLTMSVMNKCFLFSALLIKRTRNT